MTVTAQLPIRNRIWESMLDADMNARYWGHLSRMYSRNDTISKIFVAAMSSGTVGGWLANFDLFYKILSVLAAVAAIALPVISLHKKVLSTSDLHGKWFELLTEYENLWQDLETQNNTVKEWSRDLKRLKKKEVVATKLQKDLPVKNSLAVRCYKEVKASRRLT